MVIGRPALLAPLTLPRRSQAAPAESGVPRGYTAPVAAGGHRKAHPPSPADATPALPEERKRKERQGVSQTSKTHTQPTPRTETFLKPDRRSHRETFFLFHRARRIFFLRSQKENGGCIPAGKAGIPRPRAASARSPVPRPWRENYPSIGQKIKILHFFGKNQLTFGLTCGTISLTCEKGSCRRACFSLFGPAEEFLSKWQGGSRYPPGVCRT